MFGDYVMVATDIPHMDGTEQEAKYRYGDLVETSLGTGIVVDYCEMAERVRKGQLAGKQDADVEAWYDIYTAWHDGGEYERKAYHPETTPTEPTKTTKPTTPTEPTKTTKPTTPTEPTEPTTPSIPSVTEPENTESSAIKCTPEAVLKAAQNIESKENCSSYVCDILHSSGYFTEEEMNMYKDTNISRICEELSKHGWNKVTDLTNLKNGDIIIVNNGETVRIYAGNNSWYTVGNSELQQGNENWTDNISWEAYRPGKTT